MCPTVVAGPRSPISSPGRCRSCSSPLSHRSSTSGMVGCAHLQSPPRRAQSCCRTSRPWISSCRAMRRAAGSASARQRLRRPRSSKSSTRRSTRASPIPKSRRGWPTSEARRLWARPPISASSSPTTPRSGARSCERQTSSQTDHRHSITSVPRMRPDDRCGSQLEGVGMPLLDVYGRTDELDAKSIDTIATRLEARRGSAKYMGMLQEYLEAIDLAAAQSVLVLGCATGVEVREVVRRPDFRGRVTGIDISADLVERGKSLAEQKGFSGSIEWLVGDAQELRLSDGVFDLVLAHTLVSHVPDPKRVVQEAARVVRPGGTVVIFDGDYATLTFGVDREMDEKIISGNIANPRVMRAMPQLLREVGLKLVDSRGWMLTEIGRADFFLGSLQSYPVLLPKAGVATPEEVQAFVDRQLRASEEGTFFAGYNFYAMIAERPVQ